MYSFLYLCKYLVLSILMLSWNPSALSHARIISGIFVRVRTIRLDWYVFMSLFLNSLLTAIFLSVGPNFKFESFYKLEENWDGCLY